MSQTPYSITPADPDKHLIPIAQIVSDAFANGEYVDEISQQYIGNCHYDFDTTRLVWDGEQLVHHWGVWGYQMRLDSVELDVAGIGAVVTREPYRKQGLMQQAASDSFHAMHANGYDLSILRGRHYVKFGYARAWNYVKYHLKPEEIPTSNAPEFQLLKRRHLKAIADLYNQQHQHFSGTAIRPTYRNPDENEMGIYGWFDAAGKLAGYVRAIPVDEGKTLQCLEAAGDSSQALAVLGQMVAKNEHEKLTFFTLPHQHPILKRLRRGAVIVEDQYFLNTGWRVKIINLVSTLEKLRPRLELRLLRSHLANWQGQVYLDGSDQQAALVIEKGKIRITESVPGKHVLQAGPALGRLLIGSDEPGEIIQQEDITFQGDAYELAVALFPNLHPVLSHWDEF